MVSNGGRVLASALGASFGLDFFVTFLIQAKK
jgi:hypothetical protein